MRDGLRLLVVFVGLGAAVAAAVVWFGFRPAQLTVALWLARVAAPLLVGATLGVLLWSAIRPDQLPDYLREIVRRPLECEGLCFAVEPEVSGDVAEAQVFWQNRFARPCSARITLRRCHGFGVSRENLEVFSVTIRCDGGAFGLTRVPLPVPRKWQGRRKTFEVSATVRYPHRRGALLRYRGGAKVPAEGAASATMGVVAAVLGPWGVAMSAVSTGRRLRMRYPLGVREHLPVGARVHNEVLWAPGDEAAALRLAA